MILMAELPYRPNVCMILLNSEGKIFLGERFGEPGVWQLPQGGVETQFSLEENVLRELNEELGAPREAFSIIKKLNATHTYDFLKPPPYAVEKWRGQKQTFWLVRFKGNDTDINFTLHEQEFSSWKWCSVDEVLALAEPKRVAGYKAPLKEVLEFLSVK